MASIHDYNNLPNEKCREYIANLSDSERNNLLEQMQRSVEGKSDQAEFISSAIAERTPSGGDKWSSNQMSTLIIWTLVFPFAGFLFFIASQFNRDTRNQGFTILTIAFAWCLFLFFFIFVFLPRAMLGVFAI